MNTTNIHNLTSLWKTAALASETYHATPLFDYCYIEKSDWPNRLWFHQDLSSQSIQTAKAILTQTPTPLVIPYFDIYKSRSFELLEAAGFELMFEQIAMFLKPTTTFEEKANFYLSPVQNEQQANLWAHLFKQAFGYTIGISSILNNKQHFTYYIAYDNEQAVGTGLTNVTHQTVGVHSIGVPPSMRRKGFAAAIMKNLINRAIQNNRQSITLQASNMGKGLYLKLGFQEQFLIKNYRLKL
ncbi:GNAT family N-acetyltransferase [Aureispira sp. CCB-QB1]|uniref:GNAT family N-acetyltransferase n=1 Tax=Aureispira sp. CCB-QB1 TaxID=1313421 RepID=UPI0006971C90|nr:GNAT family N-acetyltransferase [Aureispira sp. CCB-QB1]